MAGEEDEQRECKDVFLSYGREPEVIFFVKQLKRDLEAHGLAPSWLVSSKLARLLVFCNPCQTVRFY